MNINCPFYHLLFPILLAAFLLSCNKEKNDQERTEGLNDLYIYDLNSNTTANITNTADVMEFNYLFYHTKAKILFSAPGGSFSMNVDGSQKHQWLETEIFLGADLSPDDGTIVFSRNKNLHLANPDGTNLRKLTFDNTEFLFPKWSGDGQKIACVSSGKMYIVTLDGKAEYISGGPLYNDWFDYK